MEHIHTLALNGLVVGCILLPLSISTTYAFDRPVHLAFLVLASVAGLSILLSRYVSRAGLDSQGHKYAHIPLDEVGGIRQERESFDIRHAPTKQVNSRSLRLAFVLLVLALLLRIEVYRRVWRDVQCAGQSYEVWIPLAFALLDFFSVRRYETLCAQENEDTSPYDVAVQHVSLNRYRYIVSTAHFGIGGIVVLRLSSGPRSTYICPVYAGGMWSMVPALQHVGTLLDLGILFCVKTLIDGRHAAEDKATVGRSLGRVGWAFGLSAIGVWLEGVIWFLFVPEDRAWLLKIPQRLIWSSVKLDFVLCLVLVSAFLCIRHQGVTTTTVIGLFTLASTRAIRYDWATLTPFPPVSIGWSLLAYIILITSTASYFVSKSTSSRLKNSSKQLSLGLTYGVLVVLFLLRFMAWVGHTSSVNYHPVDFMLYDARAQHEEYVARATVSSDLKSATKEYGRRYNRTPPPGFAQWYEFAVARHSAIIDEFDSIHNDLLPFWALEPQELRERTWELIANEWNGVAGLSIRNGKCEVAPNVPGDHRWMLDGVIAMIEKFGQHLPDMDLGFNLNDECRVVVPYEKMRDLVRTARTKDAWVEGHLEEKFSDNRAAAWKPLPEEPPEMTPFMEDSFHRTFYAHGNAACPPSSQARTQRLRDVGKLCTGCLSPHSLGSFLSNWTLSGNICHQPDLADLHGLYLSPSALKVTRELYPVFSQSRAGGWSDILYPSPWNYLDKAKYEPSEDHPDPNFESKKSTLFWRGATSEGVSWGGGTGLGAWKGMTRQRFVHLTSPAPTNTFPSQALLMPYPFSPSRGKFSYTNFPPSELAAHLDTDVHFVSEVVRCGGRDCDDQAIEFAPFAAGIDFQSHWQYKYLLDLDGAGFSGRFLPFLQSRSLPFKAALFREWYDSRLTPWLHFVPLDIRGHGLWATLMYFMGMDGKLGGKMVSVPAHEREAETIAETGREWANKVLRKEDMEIYFFRLLLEWGRLTDDRRDVLGFSVDGLGHGKEMGGS